MNIEKPITSQMKERVNTLWRYMKSVYPKYITKDEVCNVCNVKSERQAREIISVLATKKPIIAKSDNKGYKLALTIDDFEDVEHSWAELSSRIEELEKRIKPLIAFRDKIKFTKTIDNQ